MVKVCGITVNRYRSQILCEAHNRTVKTSLGPHYLLLVENLTTMARFVSVCIATKALRQANLCYALVVNRRREEENGEL
jgi:hypothetical protein